MRNQKNIRNLKTHSNSWNEMKYIDKESKRIELKSMRYTPYIVCERCNNKKKLLFWEWVKRCDKRKCSDAIKTRVKNMMEIIMKMWITKPIIYYCLSPISALQLIFLDFLAFHVFLEIQFDSMLIKRVLHHVHNTNAIFIYLQLTNFKKTFLLIEWLKVKIARLIISTITLRMIPFHRKHCSDNKIKKKNRRKINGRETHYLFE